MDGASGNESHLPDKALGVLVWLARRPGQVCGRDEILDGVWGVDREAYDRVLDNAVRDVRRALGDSAREPRYVETIPKKGYRLIAEVEWLPRPQPVALEEPTALPDLKRYLKGADGGEGLRRHEPDQSLARSARRFRILLAALSLVLLSAALRWYSRPIDTLTVSVGRIGSHPEGLASDLTDRVIEGLDGDEVCSGTVYYRFRRLGFLAGVRLTGDLHRYGEILSLEAELRGLPSMESSRLDPIKGPIDAGPEPLIEELVQRVHHRIDREICDTEADGGLVPRQACHCYRAGKRFRGERRYAQAILYLERALEAAPDHLGAIDALANLHQIRDEDDKARSLLLRALDLVSPGQELERLGFERRLAQVDEDYGAQERLLRQLRDQEPENPEWRLALGWFLQTHRRKCSESLEHYRDAIAVDPGSAYYHAYVGEAELECGAPEAAIRAFETYVELEPLSPDALDGLALALRRTGRLREAGEALRRALQLDRSYGPSYLQWGELHLFRGNFSEAERNFKLYRGSGRPDARARAELGLARIDLRRQDWDRAAEHARRALNDKEDAVEAWWMLGLAAVGNGRWEEAVEHADRIHDLRQGRSTLWQMEYFHHLEGRMYWARERWDEAIDALSDAVKLNPPDGTFFLLELADAFYARGFVDRAVDLYGQALARHPSHPDALCALGRWKLTQGDPVGALELLRRMDEVWVERTEDPKAVSCRLDLRRLELARSPASGESG